MEIQLDFNAEIIELQKQFDDLNLDNEKSAIKFQFEKMLYSFSFNHVMNYMTGPDLLKLQLVNKYIYNKLMPQYFMTSKDRKNILSKMLVS